MSRRFREQRASFHTTPEAAAPEMPAMVIEEPAEAGDAGGVVQAAIATPSASPARPGYARCRIVGAGAVVANGRTYSAGDVDEFAEFDVASLPERFARLG